MYGKSKVDSLLEKQAEAEKRKRKEIENMKLACKEAFKDVNGKIFLQYLKKICGWNDQDNNINNEILIYKKGRRDIWTIVRNILPKDVLAQIEIYGEDGLNE
ncbi:MAG: hypothetical protein LUB59_04660 [Candidatus Gastranaerophilales bacterium]|nr:hypothetical protein [Candidatus Gastranaerophilales bacterium]